MNSELEEIKKKLEELKAQHILVPKMSMIKTKEQIDGIREAGLINTGILDTVSLQIHAGMSTEEINTIVHNYTISHNAIPAPLNYEGFPKSVCTSINDVVCHGIPSKKEILKEGDIINVDVTTIYKGYYADASRMFIIGKAKPIAEKLVRVTKEMLDECVKSIIPWKSHLGDIGEICTRIARRNGFSVVENIGGHGVGLDFHEDPYVSHVAKAHTGVLLVPGMVFTIEPMVNEGRSGVYQDLFDGWTVRTIDHKLSAQWEYTIAVKEDGIEILTH